MSAQVICDSDGPPLPPVLDSFTCLPGRGAGRRRPQCRQRANCVGLSLPSDQDSPGPAGPGAAHSVRRGLTVAAAHTFDPHSPSVSPLYGVGCPQCRLRLTVPICVGRAPTVLAPADCDGCPYTEFSQCVTGQQGPGAYSVGQGLTVAAVPASGSCTSTHTNEPASQSVGSWLGWAARHHADLNTCGLSGVLVSHPTRCRLGRLSQNHPVSDPRF